MQFDKRYCFLLLVVSVVIKTIIKYKKEMIIKPDIRTKEIHCLRSQKYTRTKNPNFWPTSIAKTML